MISKGTLIANRYITQKFIAQGGMQEVYRAEDRLTGQLVALKTPQPGQKFKQFKQSATLAARVNHYSVAKTYDYVEESGRPYLIEELVQGGTLETITLASMEQVDPHFGAYLALRISKGIAASHKAGVAHRDLKPSNILISDDSGSTNVKITDFEIATLAEQLFEEVVQSGGDLTRSTSGTVKGALPYMAPEMIFRKPGDYVGTAADIWAFGAMMFRLLTGSYPFGEAMFVPVNVNNNKREAWPAFMTSKPQFAPLAKSLQTLVEICLEKDVPKRPSADEVAEYCEKLCFHFAARSRGTISNIDGSTYRILDKSGRTVFCHSDSCYGSTKLTTGVTVAYNAFPGTPYPRAHPVVALRSPA